MSTMEGQPHAKKLRFSEPDLRVVLKFTGNDGKPAEKVYQMYSQNVAILSNFWDTSLSIGMKEKAAGEIVFKDVDPYIFENAFKYQQDMRSIRSMTPKVAFELVAFYDKYEFEGGLELCDEVLSKYMRNYDPSNPDTAHANYLNFFMEAISLAKTHNLHKTTDSGVKFLDDNLTSSPFGSLPLNAHHLGLLHPFFKERLLPLPQRIARFLEDKASFVEMFTLYRSNHFLSRGLGGKMILRDKKSKWSAKFKGLEAHSIKVPEGGYYNLHLVKVVAQGDDWTVGTIKSEVTVWRCFQSGHLDYPPPGPWIPVHPLANGLYPLLYYEK